MGPLKRGDPTQRIRLNVGGQTFETTVNVITSQKGHALLHMINHEGRYESPPEKTIFIDRSPLLFSLIIDFLRKGKLNLSSNENNNALLRDLLDEAMFYGLSGLVSLVRRQLQESSSFSSVVSRLPEDIFWTDPDF